MSSPEWQSELKELPRLSLDELASEPMRLLFAALAKQQGLTLTQWLALRMRSMAVMSLPNDVREWVISGHVSRGTARPSRGQVDYAALSCPTDAADVPNDENFWSGVRRMAEEIHATAVELRQLREKAAAAAKARHRLWQRTAEDRTSESKSKSTSTSDHRPYWHRQIIEMGPERDIVRVTPRMVRAVERMLTDAPNLREPTLFVLGQLALALRGHRELRLPPMLLVGPPAAGKTWWAEQLAQALGVHSECIALPSVTANFELSGGSSQWGNGQPGHIVRAFLRTKQASPMFILDEIEKALTSNNYPVAPVLLGLLDRTSAMRWRDEFFDKEFDVSKALFVATANYPERIDSALRSRFRRIDVQAPNRSERASLIASVWRHYRTLRADLRLPTALDASVIDTLVDRFQDARQVMRLFDEGLGQAARRRGRLRLMASDVGGPVARLASWNRNASAALPQEP